MVTTDERRVNEGETVSEEGTVGVATVTHGADIAPPTGSTGGKGKKRGKRSRQGHKAERSAQEAQRGKTEVGVKTNQLVESADFLHLHEAAM